MNKRPNILWYCTDQQRWDTIRALDNPHINTPNLDRLVARGTAFEQAYCQSPICTPSRASFLTGRYPASHHVHRNGNDRFPAHEKLVTKILAENGYDCGLIGKLHLSAAAGYEKRNDDGYRFYHWSHHPLPNLDIKHHAYHQWLLHEKKVDPVELYAGIKGFCGPGVPEELHQTTWITETAIRFIEQERDGPWALTLNPFDPHPPFDPPKSYIDRYNPAALPPPLFRDSDIERQREFHGVAQQTVKGVDPFGPMPSTELSDEERQKTGYKPPERFHGQTVKAHYYAMIELIDHQFGRLVEALDAAGQADDTLIVFHSDHGEMLGDHGLLYKGCRFFEGLVHVPMIFAWAGEIREALRSRALVELVDIAPTLLDAAAIPVPSNMQGRSLWPLLTGKAEPQHHKERVVCEFNDALGSAAIPLPSHASMTFDGRYKHIVYHGLEHGGQPLGELFDLDADPGEFDNRFDDPALGELRLRLMREHLDTLMATSDAGIERVAVY